MLNILTLAAFQAATIFFGSPLQPVVAVANQTSTIRSTDGGSGGWTGDIAATDGGSGGWTGDIA